jgi:4-aminobutyrate aminotransferase
MAKNYPSITVPPPGPRAQKVIERDLRVMSQNYKKDYPLVAERGYGPVVEDPDGNRFLDFAAGIAVVATGHSHPEVVAAIKAQADRFIHMCYTDFYYDNLIALAEGLTRRAPGPGPWRAFFANSGAEVNEGAIKLARLHTGRPKIVSFYGAFHGRTYAAMSLTASKLVQRKAYGPFVPEVHHSHYAYCYRCPVNREPATCNIQCLDLLAETMFGSTVPPEEVAAVIVEPVQGEGGYVVPHPGFLNRLRALTRKHGILLIADEVQSGMGRTGKLFASEHFGLEPDIITPPRDRAEPRRPWWGNPWIWVGVSAVSVALGLLVWPGLLGGVFLFIPFVWLSRSKAPAVDPRSNGHAKRDGPF